MTDRPVTALTPATMDDLRETLAYALRFSRSGKRVADRDALTASAAAEHLLEALALNGFVVLKKPPAPAHTAHMPVQDTAGKPHG